MDGYVTIGTELDTKSFDKQIDYVKSQLDDIEDKLKKADMGFEVGDTKKLEAQYEKLTDKLRNLIKKKSRRRTGPRGSRIGLRRRKKSTGKETSLPPRRPCLKRDGGILPKRRRSSFEGKKSWPFAYSRERKVLSC